MYIYKFECKLHGLKFHTFESVNKKCKSPVITMCLSLCYLTKGKLFNKLLYRKEYNIAIKIWFSRPFLKSYIRNAHGI